MKKNNMSLLNTIIKTIISVAVISFAWWLILYKIIGPILVETTVALIIVSIVVVSFNFFCIYLLWKILPSDTKLWIKNWKKEDFVKTGSPLSLISTIIKIPLAAFGSWFFVVNIAALPFLWILGKPIVEYIVIFIIFCFILPGDIKHWIKQWNK